MAKLKKKDWKKPGLIVLTRGNRQGDVLLGCKHENVEAGVSYNATWSGCNMVGGCTFCNSRVVS